MISFEKKEINITQNIAKYKIFTIVKEKFCLEESENRTDNQMSKIHQIEKRIKKSNLIIF